jgi:CopG family nickel-responsive transcriptional regulator
MRKKARKEKVVRFGISITESLLSRYDELISAKGYTQRSEAIRDLIRNFIVEQEWASGDEETIGVLSIVYDHEVGDIGDLLIDIQHENYESIVSSLHVHLDERNCLEVLVIKDKASKVKLISDELMSRKGVKHGGLVKTTIGKGI